VAVYLDDLFDGGSLQEGGGDALLDAEDDALRCCDLIGRQKWSIYAMASLVGAYVRTPIAVEPSLMASREYSTWKRRPSGEKVLCLLAADDPSLRYRRCVLDPSIYEKQMVLGTELPERSRENSPYSDRAMNMMSRLRLVRGRSAEEEGSCLKYAKPLEV